MGRQVVDALLLPSDIVTVRRAYASVFGSPPRLLRPRTFNEKLQHAKVFKRKARHTRFADKIAVRAFVSERVGQHVLTQLFWIGTDLDAARREHLPSRFVLKADHSWGANLIVEDVSRLDWEAAKTLTKRWLDQDFSAYYGEWQYRWIPPQLLIEEYVEGSNGGVPLDYKFFCFSGRVELVEVDIDRFSNHAQAFFDRDFDRLSLTRSFPRYVGELTRPACYDSMRAIAERLAAGEPFLRVDLYDIGRPVVGELTLTPAAGLGKFDPPEWDYKFGELLSFT